MDTQMNYSNLFERRSILKFKAPAVKWFKEWVPQDVVATGGKCLLYKWVNEYSLKALQDKANDPVAAEPEPEPTTEVLFLCSYEGCGKTFIDAGALRKHAHIHGERQYVCHYEGCGKKFLDSSKLKRHFLIHTGERDFVCPHEGCGKENYHICPHPECGKRYAHEYKLKNHLASHHEKTIPEMTKYVGATPPVEKPSKASKPTATTYSSATAERPYACPYEGCDKAYIHEYKLKLHLKREHPEHVEENAEIPQRNNDNEIDEVSDQDAYSGKRGSNKSQKRPKPNLKLPPSKAAKRKGLAPSPAKLNMMKKQWPVKEETYEENDSEETEEDRDNADGWRYNNEEDDEETEDED